MIEFNDFEEIEKYYNEKTKTYEFVDTTGLTLDVEFKFIFCDYANIFAGNIKGQEIHSGDICAENIFANTITAGDIKSLNIDANDINAGNIEAQDIRANDIVAWNINASNIIADNIDYEAVCFAYKNIICSTINSDRDNHKHFVLDGKLIIGGKEIKE